VDRQFVLYWGAKNLAGLYQPGVPGEWQGTHRNFSFIPVLSETGPADNWPGRTGFVHEAVLADFADLSGYEVYACGAPAMVAAAKREFSARGLPEDAFFSDSFDFQTS
jgi:CDP-4-dehydro-6-deoxyglucose reductase